MSSMTRRPKRLSAIEMQSVVHEAYAVHFILMGLGFLADEIFAGTAHIANSSPPGLCATVELHAQGKQFIYTLRALVPGDDDRFVLLWKEFAAGQPSQDKKDLDALVHGSIAWRTKGAIIGALADKGFTLPFERKEAPNVGRDAN